jgi:flavin reductase (DIM6/NTAB) family NADH-FMN oxidoreductase RutF
MGRVRKGARQVRQFQPAKVFYATWVFSTARNTIIYLGGTANAEKPSRVEKSGLKVFYGKLKTAPMLAMSPVSYECSVAHLVDFGSHQMVVVRLEYVHVEKSPMPGGTLSASKRTPTMAGGPDSIEFLNKLNPIYRYHVFDKKQPGRDVRSFLGIWTSPDATDKELARISWVAEPPTPANTARFEKGKK